MPTWLVSEFSLSFNLSVTTSSSKKLVFVLPRINRSGGQERSTLEILQRLPKDQWQIHVLSFVFNDCEELKATWHRVPGFFLPTQLVRNLWFSLYTYFYLLLKFKPSDLIVTVGVASWRADVRVIQFFHHKLGQLVKEKKAVLPNARGLLRTSYQKLFSWWSRTLEKHFFSRTSRLIAISQSVARDLVDFLSLENVQVIHHAPEESVLHSRQSDNEVPVILFVGALERKGIEKSLECLSELQDLKWKFHVVGDGDIARWQERASDLGIADRVTFFGFQKVEEFYEKADIFLFPSLYEPFGLVVSEAITHRLAVLASSECGAMELWANRDPWLVLSASEENARWLDALRRLLENKELRLEVSEQAHKSLQAWNWSLAAAKYNEVFLSVKK